MTCMSCTVKSNGYKKRILDFISEASTDCFDVLCFVPLGLFSGLESALEVC
jgi:hypothetical protein